MTENQECLGTNILSVKKKIVHADWLFERIPQYSYDNIIPDKWYPMKQFTLLVDYYEEQTGPNVLRHIGRGIIPEMKEAGVLPNMDPQDFLRNLPSVYNSANRGNNIGNWNILKEENKHMIIENSTMHNCILEEGVVYGGITAFGGKFPQVKQLTCVRNGDSVCTFDLTWK